MRISDWSSDVCSSDLAKWLSDDYVKFIRFGEHMIERNGKGVLAFITNHGYLDNPTFLDMRDHLRKTFDRIYVLDLHGNAKKKEVAPDGSPDKNVFDIQQGVAIFIAIRLGSGSACRAFGNPPRRALGRSQRQERSLMGRNRAGVVRPGCFA